MRGFFDDVRFAVRMSLRNRAVTAAVAGTMIVGLAATTSMFSAVNGVLLRPLPFHDSDRVVRLSMLLRNGIETPMLALPDVEDFRRDAKLYSAFTTATLAGATLIHGETPLPLLITNVDSGYASVFAVTPVVGRFLSAADYLPDAPRTVVISHGLWQREFGGDSGIVGQSVNLGSAPAIVIGVLPPSPYTFPYPGIDLIAPLVLRPGTFNQNRGALWLRVAARMKPGVSVDRGRAEILNLGERIATAYPDAYKGLAYRVESLRAAEVADARPMLLLLAGTMAAVLLIACVNIANVLLAQSHARSREFAVRAALGASAMRIRRQLLTESLLLTGIGGAVGVALAPLATKLLISLYPGELPRAGEIGVDGRVLVGAVLAMVVAGVAAGWPTARRAVARDLTRDLRSGARTGASRGHRRVGNALIVTQVAISLALVFSASVLVRTFRTLTLTNVGFKGAGVLTFAVNPSRAQFPDATAIAAFSDKVQRALLDIPGVTQVAGASQMPFTGNAYRDVFVRPEIGEQGPNNPFARFETVTRGYWSIENVPVVAGRTFGANDLPGSPRVVVISQTAAAKFFPGLNAVGRHIQYNRHDWEIIGVTGAIRMEDPAIAAPPIMYLSAEQQQEWPGYVLVKSSGSARALIPAVRAAIAGIDPTAALREVQTLDSRIADGMAPERFRAAVTSALGVLALLLSTIGIYGVISHAVGRETRDTGVRLALGEERGNVWRAILGRALRTALIGIVAGAGLALAASRWLAAFLVGSSPFDPWALGFAALLLLGASALAAYVPAKKASAVDPMMALRSE